MQLTPRQQRLITYALHFLAANADDDEARDLKCPSVESLVSELQHQAAIIGGMIEDPRPAPLDSGCEFCLPIEGDPFTNRPRGEEWTCPYCHTQFTGKERK